jgi:hypothetical protein
MHSQPHRGIHRAGTRRRAISRRLACALRKAPAAVLVLSPGAATALILATATLVAVGSALSAAAPSFVVLAGAQDVLGVGSPAALVHPPSPVRTPTPIPDGATA